ncbi:hypothetical protein ALQ08_01402, partial [Pseudomonas syringae pv. delphinii]
NDNLNYRAALRVACRSGRSASGLECAVRRRFVTQERHATHSDAGACGTITLTIVRRSASHAVLDAPRPVLNRRRGAGL